MPAELLAYTIDLTWTIGKLSRYEEWPALDHFGVLQSAQLINRAFHAASRRQFQALLPSDAHAARWLAAMTARGELAARAALLRVLCAVVDGAPGSVVLREAAGNLGVIVVPDVLEGFARWPSSLPALRWLAVGSAALDTVAQHMRAYSMPSLATVVVECVLPGTAPDWPAAGAAALSTLVIHYQTDSPDAELGNLHRIVGLRSLRVVHVYAGELADVFNATEQPAPAVTHLSLGIASGTEKREDFGLEYCVAVQDSMVQAARRLPSLSRLTLTCRHTATSISANFVLEAVAALLADDAAWPMLQRVEVRVATEADNEMLLGLRAACGRRGIEVATWIGSRCV